MMMPLKSLNFWIKFFLPILILQSCIQSEYTKVVKEELARGVRMDSLVFGINFGDSRDEFYGKCFDLNKKELVTQGPKGATVQHLFTDSLLHNTPTPMRLLFIPAFDEKDKIIEMNLEFSYVAWAPWNENLQSNFLKDKVLELITLWYKGNSFISVEIKGQQTPVKLDGNRRMIVYIKDEQNVVVKIHDILHPKYRHSVSIPGEKD
jgi:hypothetical protein